MSSKEVGFKEAGDASASHLEELIVKSATNHVDDVVLKYDNLWSVKKLKERIAELYPCKLLVEDQKLIYSGKLLTDDLILKDIIRSFDDPEVNKKQKHIFHLVYSSKTKQALPTPLQKTSPSPMVSNTTTTQTMTDGLRQRHIQQSVGSGLELEGDSSSHNAAHMISFPVGSAGPQYYMAQQMAMHNWMQQVYWQYMNQYMNLTNSSENRPPGNHPIMPQNFIPQIPAMPYFPATNFPQPTAASPQVPRPEPQQQMAAQAQAPQPRFPNIVQEEQENRDWLDIFYLGCRLMLFIMLIYFYSSAARCIVVIGGAIGIYMYHNGYFRNRNPVETNNNNVNNNDRNVEEERLQAGEEPLQQQGEDGVVEPQPPIAEESREAGETAPEVLNSGSSVMSIVKTFVVTFITSLLPDTQTL